MKMFTQLFFENNAFIINNGLLKLKFWTNQLAGLLYIYIYIEFHSKICRGTNNGLKNEMIKLNVKYFVKNLTK
jgi:hypothetical protein